MIQCRLSVAYLEEKSKLKSRNKILAREIDSVYVCVCFVFQNALDVTNDAIVTLPTVKEYWTYFGDFVDQMYAIVQGDAFSDEAKSADEASVNAINAFIPASSSD